MRERLRSGAVLPRRNMSPGVPPVADNLRQLVRRPADGSEQLRLLRRRMPRGRCLLGRRVHTARSMSFAEHTVRAGLRGSPERQHPLRDVRDRVSDQPDLRVGHLRPDLQRESASMRRDLHRCSFRPK